MAIRLWLPVNASQPITICNMKLMVYNIQHNCFSEVITLYTHILSHHKWE